MREGWATKTLEDVCQFCNGLWKGEKPPFVKVGVIRNTNFTKEGTLDDSDIAYLDVEAKKLETRHLQLGDIILEKSGGGPKQPVGRVALFEKEAGNFSFSNFTAALRVLDARELDFRFLHKFLHWTYISGVTEAMQSHSTGIRNLNSDAYKGIRINFPPLPEQQRIVGVLDEAFAGLATAQAHAEKNLQNARVLFESHLQSIFTRKGDGWVEKKLEDVCEIQRGGSPRPIKMFITSAHDGINWIKIGDASASGKYIYETEEKIAPAGVKRSRMVHPDDFILSNSMSFGRPYIMKTTGCIHDGWLVLRQRQKQVDQDFLYYMLSSDTLFRQFDRLAAGSTVRNLNIGLVKRVDISYPALAEQLRIVAKLDALSTETQRLESLYQQKLAALAALKRSLLHQAFSGAL